MATQVSGTYRCTQQHKGLGHTAVHSNTMVKYISAYNDTTVVSFQPSFCIVVLPRPIDFDLSDELNAATH